MTRPGDRVRLEHMLDAVVVALDFVADKQQADFDYFPPGRSHLIRALEVLGEAAAGVSGPTRARFPEVPWAPMISMRNKLIHAYFAVDFERVWITVRDRLPQLREQLEQALGEDWE